MVLYEEETFHSRPATEYDMAKANKYYKQPKMKQKDYFEVLKKQRNLEYLFNDPSKLHQSKQQRGGLVKRSGSDVSYRSVPPSFPHAYVYKSHSNNNSVKRSSSDVNYQQRSLNTSGRSTPYNNNNSVTRSLNDVNYQQRSLNKSGRSTPNYPMDGNMIQRSVSDSIRLEQYRNSYTNNVSRNNSMNARPKSLDAQRPRKPPSRTASVDLTPRPRSILKKSSSSNDLDSNHSLEEDLIFDDEYLDYISPRDALARANGDNSQNMNYSFEDQISRDHLAHTRVVSPKTVKHVNFNNELTFHRNSIQSNGMTKPRTRYVRDPNRQSIPPNLRALTPQSNHRNQAHQLNNHINQNYDNGDKKQEQPYELRKPLFGENNVVDFGTFISKKLSKLKFKSKKKSHISYSKDKVNGYQGGHHDVRDGDSLVRTSTDGNFTMVSKRSKNKPLTKEDFMTEEILY